MRHRVVAIMAVTAMFFGASATAARWSHVSVPGGAVQDLAMASGQVLYAATTGGLYRSTDAGNNWAFAGVLGESEFVHRVYAVDGDPARLVTYVTTRNEQGDQRAVIKASIDGGATWVVNGDLELFTSTQPYFVGHRLSPGLVLLATVNRLLRSVDGGLTWETTGSSTYHRNMFAIDDAPGHFIALTASRDRISESRDGGLTWATVPLQGQIPYGDVLTVEQDPIDSGLLYFAVLDWDAGVPLSGRIDTRQARVTSLSDTCDCLHARVVADPHQAGRLLALALNVDAASHMVTRWRMRESLDGGATWHDLSELAGKFDDKYRFHFDAVVPGRLYMPTAGAGIYRSDDGGRSFIPRYDGMNDGLVVDFSVDPLDPDDFVLIRDLLPPLHTTDGGRNLSPVRAGFFADQLRTGEQRRMHRAYGNSKVLIAFGTMSLYKSFDGGASWAPWSSNFPFATQFLKVIRFAGSGTQRLVAYSRGYRGGAMVHWSSDGGSTWLSTPASDVVSTIQTTAGDDDPIYLSFDSYSYWSFTLSRADRFGEPFGQLTAPAQVDQVTQSRPDPNDGLHRLMAAYNQGSTLIKLWETVDGGDSWILRGNTNAGSLMSIDACDGRTVWSASPLAVSRDGGRVFRDDFLGRFWTDKLQNFCLDSKSYVYAIGSGLMIREPEAGGTLLRSGFEP
jgi:photosystem II stability/assembly factor-like uncharacterized protein